MENELIERAEKILLKYHDEHLKENSDQVAIKAMAYDSIGSPGTPKDNPEEAKIANHLEAHIFCEQVRQSINSLKNEKYRNVLINKYIEELPNVHMIADASGIGKSTYFRVINPALIEFSKACPAKI